MKIITSAFLLFLSITCVSQDEVRIYKTMEDHENGVFESYSEYVNLFFTVKKLELVLRKSGSDKKHRLSGHDFWGMEYKDALFVVDPHTKVEFARLVSVGRICYYENARAHLSMLRSGAKSGEVVGRFCYVSKEVGSRMYGIPYIGIDAAKKTIGEFTNQYPEFKAVVACLTEDPVNFPKKRVCIDEFEGTE
jgi:hypothetical protein